MLTNQEKPKNENRIVICHAHRKDGEPCRRLARKGETYCWQHSPKFWSKARQVAKVVGGILGSIAAAIILYTTVIKNIYDVKLILFPTATPTVTQTYTATSTATSTYTPTPTLTSTPQEQGIYYIFVLDASLKMQESFETQTKWNAALRAVDSLLVGLEAGANYGLVAIGGEPNAGSSDPCHQPSTVTVPFTTREAFGKRVGQLQPEGGGSLYQAFVTAVGQFSNVPTTSPRTIIYITGSEDACTDEDEWAALERYFKVKGDAGLTIYSEIIIIDDKDGIKTQTLAERISSISNKVNAQAPQTVFQLVQSNNIVINNVTNYVTNIITALATNTPTQTLIPTLTATLRPGETPATQPIIIPTNTFTFTPTFTKTVPPSFTPSPTTSVCPPASHPFLAGPAYGGSVSIYAPGHCSTGFAPETAISSGGAYSNIPEGTIVWELVYAPDGLYYPQSPNACVGGPPPYQGGGSWNVDTYLGKIGQEPTWYDIVVVLADQAASDYLSSWLVTACQNGFPGMNPANLASLNITEKTYITVQTR